MKIFIAVLAVIMALSALATACGDGGEELTLDEYFQRLDALVEDADQRFEALFGDEFVVVFDPEAAEQERLDAAQLFSQEFQSIVGDFLAALQALDPPAEVEGAHNEALAAGGNFRETLSDAFGQLADAESASELDAVLAQFEEDPEFDAADQRFVDACLALQGIADDNNIDVDLECEEE